MFKFVFAILLCFAMPAVAWKPTSHVYFAQIAASDALDDGIITLPVLGGAELNFKVDAHTLAALKNALPYYRSGVLGPDAYPDILTGQQIIHPPEKESKAKGGPDGWMQHIWNNFDGSEREHAFRLGFLTHAAGDMFGHTFVNNFSGGAFTFAPPDNAIKHIVLEGYIDKRLPKDALTGDFFKASISGLEHKIYTTMVDAARTPALKNQLLRADSPAATRSVPIIFSQIRQKAHHCTQKKWQGGCKFFPNAYFKGWVEDIDAGLQAWPATSHATAEALFFNASRKSDLKRAKAVMEKYKQDHLLLMAGVPKWAVKLGVSFTKVMEALKLDFLLAPIHALQKSILNAMIQEATGMSVDELAKYLSNPEIYFDDVMSTGQGETITLGGFNSKYLKIDDNGYSKPNLAFDYNTLPAAYNSVIVSKLILLSPNQINQLMSKLGGANAPVLKQPNVMLGFIRTLDGSTQWRAGMAPAKDCKIYNQLFMELPNKAGC